MTNVVRRAPRDAEHLRVGIVRQSVNPTSKRGSPLLQVCTTRRNLTRAWLQVRPRALKSKNSKTRADAEAFGKDIEASIHRLQAALRNVDFQLEKQRGVIKKGKRQSSKKPRPLVIAPLTNRVVQRAILDICQSEERSITKHLGILPHVISTPTSVGGLPRKGVPDARALIVEQIRSGAKWFVRSDLVNFFQTIPKPAVAKFLYANISDEKFAALFMTALATELENEDEVRELLHLFPRGDMGVPQGSALSALCANIVLSDFDTALNGRGIRTIRYLDDFIILGPDKASVIKAWISAQKILSALEMECHNPEAGAGKAAMGEISGGFEFLSFYFDDKDVYPSSSARSEFLDAVNEHVRNAKTAIHAAADETRRAEPRFVQSLNSLDRIIRGWSDAFAGTNKHIVLSQLDAKIDRILIEYAAWFQRICKGKSPTHLRRLNGIALVVDMQAARDRD